MDLLRKIICDLFGFCYADYNRDDDPIFVRYLSLEKRVDDLEYRVDRMWKPRDLLDIR